ncbi:histidine kinase [Streptomyces sp. XM4193]|uniref:sensor histidine kinase n=1 Tax=Streptomyces sp. XM4193 TaxID=2929782 RepID=UPI001FF711E9|nr:histidine kinase [Streptomyces sp. XM4193]MCK1799132.1 histidine kinase [Streptomyces sp. XM4193]
MKHLRQLPARWQQLPVYVRDLPLGLLVLLGSLTPSLHNKGTQIGGVPDRPFDLLALAAIALQCLPLAVRRRFPVVAVVLVVAGFAVDQLRGYHSFAGSALPIALLSAGAHVERHRRLTFGLLAASYVPFALALGHLGSGEGPAGYLLFLMAVSLAWGAGVWLRNSRAEEVERRRRVADETRTAERTRIARELHDVVTHHVTAMVVQAEAAKYLTAAPDRLDATLTSISDTGRRAITDLRHLLDLLNPEYATAGSNAGGGQARSGEPKDDGPQPAAPADDAREPHTPPLHTLVEQTRAAGQPVEFEEEGRPSEPTGSADLVAYRVVQESLTNALKYAHGEPTSVHVRHGERHLTVQVTTLPVAPSATSEIDKPHPNPTRPPGSSPRRRSASLGGSGRGLAGLRERVAVLGGEFAAGPADDGTFRVRARVPTGRPSTAPAQGSDPAESPAVPSDETAPTGGAPS